MAESFEKIMWRDSIVLKPKTDTPTAMTNLGLPFEHCNEHLATHCLEIRLAWRFHAVEKLPE